ncbi:PH domain-containing protein [Flavobacterium sp.]|uniref:PH domain-containing protein n=1 Tax=Flavobacterium sp. TaxID=239 RepID=UPI00286A0BEE|nr:PH domain-containing protein [Flavobacterium sp.]
MKQLNFNLPQRQSVIGIIVLFADTFQSIVRALIPLIAIWVFKFDQINKIYLVLSIFIVIGIVGIIAYIQYINFTFYIDTEKNEFVINKGVLNKTKIAIQLDKIQQVNINQSFIQKIIKVYSLEVDTAGSSNKEVKIRAISKELAEVLKGKLLEKEFKSDKVESEIQKSEDIIKISLLSLIKVGLTSKYAQTFALLLAFFATIYENFNQWSQNNAAIENKIDSYVNQTSTLFLASFFILILLFTILIINLTRTIVKYFNFKIEKQQESLVLSYGLLNTRNTIIKPEKVQIITLSRNFFQRNLNVLDIKIKQASLGETEKEERKSAIEIPGCSPAERDQILKLLLSKIPEHHFVLLPNIRSIIIKIFKYIFLPIVILILIINNVEISNFNYLFIAPLYFIIVVLSIYFSFINYKLFIGNDHIVKQNGVWDIDKQIIEIHKIQAIKTSQLFWHKKPNIGSITLCTAGGNITFRLANFEQIKQFVNIWLYQVESSQKSWNT